MHIRIVEKHSSVLVITDLKLFTLVSSLMPVTIFRKPLLDSLGPRVKTFTLDRNLLYVHMVYKLFLLVILTSIKISHSVCNVGKSSAQPVSVALIHRYTLERI